jgi:hypothetical protein
LTKDAALMGRVRTVVGLLSAGIVWFCGCATVPANHIRLIGSTALDLSWGYPRHVAFDRGVFTTERDEGSVVLMGSGAAMLFDYRGPDNRFELLLRRDAQSILYHRLGQRPVMAGGGRLIPRPVGLRIDQENGTLEGSIDVVLGRVDLHGFGPAFEHYPKQMRIMGRFRVLRCSEWTGPTSQPSAFWRPSGRTRRLADVDEDWLMGRFAADLPSLPEPQ